MPNHLHGILILNDDVVSTPHDKICGKSTVIGTENVQMSAISPKSGSISRIVGSYKSAVSKHAHRLGFECAWQEQFYDHIIRNEKSLERITNYIRNNPRKWEEDKDYRANE